jgi:hypothetical protein
MGLLHLCPSLSSTSDYRHIVSAVESVLFSARKLDMPESVRCLLSPVKFYLAKADGIADLNPGLLQGFRDAHLLNGEL